MPRVQTYNRRLDPRRLDPAGLPDVRRSLERTPQVDAPLLRVNPDTGAERLGNTIAQLGEGVFQESQRRSAAERQAQAQAMLVAQKQQREERVSVAERDFLSQLHIRTNDPQIGWFTTRQGDDARGLPDEATKFSNELYDKISKGLPNDETRLDFAQKARRHQDNFDLDVMKYTSGEITKAETANSAALVDLEMRGVVAGAHDPHRIADGVVAIDKELQRFGDSHGQTQPTVDDKKAKAHSDLWDGVIRRLMVDSQDPKNPMREMSLPFAKAYFEAHGDEIEVNKRNELKTRLDVTVNESSAAQYANAAFRDNGPKSDAAPLEMDKILEPLRKKFATSDPELYKAIKTQVEDLGKTFTESVKARGDYRKGSVWKAVSDGTPLDQITATPEFQMLPGEEQNRVKEHVVDRTRMLANVAGDAAAYIRNQDWQEKSRAHTEAEWAKNKKDGAAYALYNDLTEDAEKVRNMTEAEIYGYTEKLGFPLRNQLLKEHNDLISPNKATVTKVNMDYFNKVADEHGLGATKKKKTDLEKRRLGALKSYIKDQFAAETKPGEELDQDRQQEIIDNAVIDLVLAPGPFGGAFLGTVKKRYAIELTDIPAADLERLRNVVREQRPGREPKPDEIIEQFIFEKEQQQQPQPSKVAPARYR